MPERAVKYAAVPPNDRLRQGEILVELVRVRQTLDSIGRDNVRLLEISHPFVIVLTQDCDLSQDAAARDKEAQASKNPALLNDEDFLRQHGNAPKHKIENVLFCEAFATSELKKNAPQGKDIWKRIIQNKDERYQCVEAIPPDQDWASQGIPSLGCDFKRFFTVPADELYKRLELQQIVRRSRLVTPYAEHLLHRFCNYQARVPLPENHEVPL